MAHTTSGELTSPSGSTRIDTPKRARTQHPLGRLLKKDRLQRRLSWPAYAKLLGLKESTLYKIAQGYHQPREITDAIIRDRLKELG